MGRKTRRKQLTRARHLINVAVMISVTAVATRTQGEIVIVAEEMMTVTRNVAVVKAGTEVAIVIERRTRTADAARAGAAAEAAAAIAARSRFQIWWYNYH